jgi:hypothetical protein
MCFYFLSPYSIFDNSIFLLNGDSLKIFKKICTGKNKNTWEVRLQRHFHTNFKKFDTWTWSQSKKNEWIGRVVKKKRIITLYANG